MTLQSYAWCLLFLVTSLLQSAISQQPKYFNFQDNFWINLHHTLCFEAKLRATPVRPMDKVIRLPLPVTGFANEEKQAWEKAVQYYVTTFSGHRLLFDRGLVAINNALADNEDPATLSDNPDIPTALAAVLRAAGPVYRQHWWPAHLKANQEWIASMRSRVDEMSPAVIPRLEELLQDKWPSAPDRFDVTYVVAEIGGAYTTEHPGHTTLASSEVDNTGPEGLETVFHEGAHLLTAHLEHALVQECRAQKKDCGDLWHAVQFFTVGEVVKAEFARRGTSNFIPYAYKFGLYERGRWSIFRVAMEKNWQPYLVGKTNFTMAIKNLVAGLP